MRVAGALVAVVVLVWSCALHAPVDVLPDYPPLNTPRDAGPE